MTITTIIGCSLLYILVGMFMGAILEPSDEPTRALAFITLWPLFVVVAIVLGAFRLFRDMMTHD